MKIVHLSTSDVRGGAALAAYRLHGALLRAGHDSLMLVRHMHSADDSVIKVAPVDPGDTVGRAAFLSGLVQKHYIDANRTDLSDTIFTVPYPGYDLSSFSLVRMADIIDLHWVARYQSPVTLRSLFAIGNPVVWTLHDQWPFTGGCHYSAGCDKYRHDCVECPQLADDPFGLPQAVLRDKLALFPGANLTIVSPSRWLADRARESRLFKDLRIEVIGNGLDTRVFTPVPKTEAKASLGVDPNSTAVLFVADRGDERRKGGTYVVDALRYCLRDREFASLARSNRITLLAMGRSAVDLSNLGLPVVSLGYFASEKKVSAVYAAADIFLLPSLEDNLPNTMLEAMSCGTPVVAFDSGGIRDAVGDWVTGRLVPTGDTHALAEAMMSLVFDPDKRRSLGRKSRQVIEEAFSSAGQATRYLALYAQLLEDCVRSGRGPMPGPVGQVSGTAARNTDLSSIDAPAFLETASGPHFSAIYDQVLLRALKEAVPAMQKDHEASVKRLEDLHHSLSWRITGPLRKVGRALGKLRQ